MTILAELSAKAVLVKFLEGSTGRSWEQKVASIPLVGDTVSIKGTPFVVQKVGPSVRSPHLGTTGRIIHVQRKQPDGDEIVSTNMVLALGSPFEDPITTSPFSESDLRFALESMSINWPFLIISQPINKSEFMQTAVGILDEEELGKHVRCPLDQRDWRLEWWTAGRSYYVDTANFQATLEALWSYARSNQYYRQLAWIPFDLT